MARSDSKAIDTRTIRLFAQYLTIGGVVFCIDAGLFQLFVLQHALLPVAATIGYVVGVIAHFSLNRMLNFRNFDRHWREQATTYVTIVFFQWLLTIAVIEACVHVLMTAPFVAKIAAVVVNIPVGFIAHRYFTFGPGIMARVRQFTQVSKWTNSN